MGCFSDRKLLGKLMKLPENFAKMTLFLTVLRKST